MKKFRARDELKLKLIKTIIDFKSEEEPGYKLTKEDIINCLSAIIARKTE